VPVKPVDVERTLEDLARDLATASRPVLRSYFDESCGPRLSLTSIAKVVVRLEVRERGAYLDVSLGEVGEQGKVCCHVGLGVQFTQAAPKEIPSDAGRPDVLNVRLTKPQLEELCLQEKTPQPTYGRWRARVQRRLVELDLSRFDTGMGLCSVTERGRFFLVTSRTPSSRSKP
jgi:hypothetical protein